MKHSLSAGLRAAFALCAALHGTAWAQDAKPPATAASTSASTAAKTAAPACPPAVDTVVQQLYGLWRASFDAPPEPRQATLLFEKSSDPELADTVGGGISREGANGTERAEVAGDVDKGEFTLEESADGRAISATWTGRVVEGSCGREIRGTWLSGDEKVERAFVLRKQPGWQ